MKKPEQPPGKSKHGAGENYERPSARMFRRSRAAQERRRQAALKDDRFMRIIFGIAGFAVLLAFLFFFMLSAPAGAADYYSGRIGINSWL